MAAHIKFVFLTLYLMENHAMMLRNDALISKMVSDFQKDNTNVAQQAQRHEVQQQQQQQPKNVLTIMQSVLCRNFPTIPCDMIVEDETLRTLIERSIQQLKYKKMSMEKTTPLPGYHLTLFPTITNEDLSNFLQVSDAGFYPNEKNKLGRKHRKKNTQRNNGEEKKEYRKKGKKRERGSSVYGSPKKIRKFYPHKIKYKDKQLQEKVGRDNFGDYSDEKLSMSVEVPDAAAGRKRNPYRMDPADPPVWRIDYMKHGEPSLNMFGYTPDRLNEKLVKTGPNVIIADSFMEQTARKDVMHPDVYIKKNYIRKNALDLNSEGMD